MSVDKIIHIANNFISSKVHRDLILALLRNSEVRQEVFVAVRRKDHVGVHDYAVEDGCEIKYCYCLRPFFRYFPLLKVLWVTMNCMWSVDCVRNSSSVLVAHTLWSDGMVAFFIHLLKKREYILIVRNTDINVFLPLLPHYRFLMKCSVQRAKALVFVSHAHKERFSKNYPALFNAASVVKVIPNGLDGFWLNNIPQVKDRLVNKDSKKIIYVGRFDKNKNLPSVIKAVEFARKNDPKIVLILVGGSLEQLKKLCAISDLPSWVTVEGVIDDKRHLLTLYRGSSVFIMPSFYETFGLVYLEALSQGCPFIYTANEGVDGYFNDDDFAISIHPKDINEIAKSILILIDRFPLGVPFEKISLSISRFSWQTIALNYQQLIDL